MEPLRFIHAADLHLDSPFRGLGEASAGLRNQLQSATLAALSRVVDHTINAKADFLIIAGDIYDSKDRNLRALVSFRKEMERLAERNIPAYIVHGNHDPLNGWGSGFQLSSPPSQPMIAARSFGHAGAGGQLAFADADYRVGFAYLSNQMGGYGYARARELTRALRAVLGA